MKAIFLCLLLAGCAATDPRYDLQFCTVNTDKGCKAWVIGAPWSERAR